MSGIENFAKEAQQIETEIVRKGIALNIDWDDALVVRTLACEAFDHIGEEVQIKEMDLHQRARIELFGLANLMLAVMRESANEDIYTHGGPVWKAFGGALWAEYQGRLRNK